MSGIKKLCFCLGSDVGKYYGQVESNTVRYANCYVHWTIASFHLDVSTAAPNQTHQTVVGSVVVKLNLEPTHLENRAAMQIYPVAGPTRRCAIRFN
jgi:hypothetical protein